MAVIQITTGSSVASTAAGPTTAQSVFNELDEMGLLLGLERLDQERNPAYKQRLMTMFSLRAASTYRGLVNAITRGLGLTQSDAIRITALKSGGSFIATDPNVIISEAFVYLYEDFSEGEDGIDSKIDRFAKDGTAYTLSALVGIINDSAYYSASVETDADEFARSMTIINQSMRTSITSEEITLSKKIVLANQNIINGTLFFSDRSKFLNEVGSEALVVKLGDYTVDYTNGIVTAFETALPATTVRYDYIRDPMICDSSPVIIHDIQHADFKVKLFDQLTTDAGGVQNGLATGLGADIITELMSVYPAYWGR